MANGWWVVIAVLAGSTACGSASAYLRGPPPPAALPDPEVRVSVRELTKDGASSASRVVFESSGPRVLGGDAFEMAGRVTRFARGFAPRWELRVAVGTPDREAVLDVALYREMPGLDLRPDGMVTIRTRRTENGYNVEILDDKGAVFHMVAGGATVVEEGAEVQANMLSREAYWEVRSSEDLCTRTDAFRPVRVRFGGDSPAIPPGESQVLCHKDCRLVVVASARETEEMDCGDREPPHQILFWIRVANESR